MVPVKYLNALMLFHCKFYSLIITLFWLPRRRAERHERWRRGQKGRVFFSAGFRGYFNIKSCWCHRFPRYPSKTSWRAASLSKQVVAGWAPKATGSSDGHRLLGKYGRVNGWAAAISPGSCCCFVHAWPVADSDSERTCAQGPA